MLSKASTAQYSFSRIGRRVVLPLLLLSGSPRPSFSTFTPPTGPCQLSETWTELPLINTEKLTKQTSSFTYQLPNSSTPLNLSPCSCLLVRNKDGVVRPYTPTSNNEQKGSLTLTVKHYPNGILSSSIFSESPLEFSHIPANVKVRKNVEWVPYVCYCLSPLLFFSFAST